jgi:1A family penicillin-binding protein
VQNVILHNFCTNHASCLIISRIKNLLTDHLCALQSLNRPLLCEKKKKAGIAMAGTGRKKPPLVAERRYSSPKKAVSTPRKTATKRSTPKKAGKKKAQGNLVTRFLRTVVGWVFKLIWRITWRVTAVVALIIGGAVAYQAALLPAYTDLVDGRARGSVTLLDSTGEVFAWRGDQFGGMITATSVSKHLHNAVVATEDKRFYWHPGVDPRGIASAIKINLREGRGPLSGHGGSTLTQQTAKLLCLGVPYDPDAWDSERAYEADCRRGTLWRKAKEAVFAVAMELKYTKEEILTIYFNRAFLGAGARGFEAASQRYFGKSAADVNVQEAAMLAGLLVAPSRFAPTNNLERAQNRASVIVGLMEDQGYLTAAEAQVAQDNPAELSEAAAAKAGGYFADWVMSTGPDFFTKSTTEDVIIRTTLDQRLQTAAEEAMQTVFENKVREGSKAQAAIVVMSADGAVRAMVGGRDTKVTGAFNRATQAKRQTGSAFKPFVYAAALDLGYSFNDWVEDEPLTINVPGSGPYSPKNYSGEYKGLVTLTAALTDSLNTPAVRVSESVGRENVRHIAEDFGIESDLALGPALALGASESSLLEMAGAYAGILNGGSSVTPYGLIELRLLGDEQPLMGTGGGIGERVITERAARQLTFMMSQVVQKGTGRRAILPDREVAGKTGTTQAARDAWFIGFTADYVAGVWMGYDDNTPLNGVTGSGLPAEIWFETMSRIHAGTPARALPMIRPTEAEIAGVPPTSNNSSPGGNGSGNAIEQALRNIFGGN